jgi:hypothetical protein
MLIDSYEAPGAEQLLLVGQQRHADRARARRLLITEAIAAAAFLVGAGLLAGLSHAARPFSWSALVVTVVAYLVAGRVRYPVGSAWTAPTQLVFVPMLFVLPTPWVPLIVAGCSLADRLPQALRGDLAPSRVFARVADSFYALGPALVLVLFGAQIFSWSHWPLFLAAFGAQVLFDAGAGFTRTWFAEHIAPAGQLQMAWLYITDFCLSCIGIVIAASAVARPGLVLLALPLVGLQWMLARERQARLSYSLALKEEHRIAVELQRGLLPKHLPQVEGLDFAAHYEAAGRGAEAGGDWYDAFALPEGRIGIVVGDVTGRGIAAASTMGQLRSVTRAFALGDQGTRAPGDVLTRLNRYQLALDEEELFTVIYALIDPGRGTVAWAAGGHPPPLLRTASGATRVLEGGGPVMGIWDVVYEDAVEAMSANDTLILYSDGLVERRGESLDTGLTRLAAAAAEGPDQAAELCRHVLHTLLSPPVTLRDDVTAMFVTLNSREPAPPGSEAALAAAAEAGA